MATRSSSGQGITKVLPTVCEFCGQPLLNKEAVHRLGRARAKHDAMLLTKFREQAERDAKRKVDTATKAVRNELARRESELQTLKQTYAKEKAALSARAKKEAEARVKSSVAKRERDLHNTIEKQKEHIREQERRIDRLSAPDIGDWSEESLLQELRRAFPRDDIKRQGRGKRGGDIIHEVFDSVSQQRVHCGSIIWECKDTLGWAKSYLVQIKKAGAVHQSTHLVLVSQALPKKAKEFWFEDGVAVVHPARALHLARLIRTAVVSIRRAGLTSEGREAKTAELYEYLASKEFRQAFDSLSDAAGELNELLRDERNRHEQIWTRRRRHYDEIAARATAIDESIRAIMERPAQRASGKVVAMRPRARMKKS